MEKFPKFFYHCKSLGHFDMDCPCSDVMPVPVGDRGGILLRRRQWMTEVRFCYADASGRLRWDSVVGYDSLLSRYFSNRILQLLPKHVVSYVNVANAVVAPIDDDIRLTNIGPVSNLAYLSPIDVPLVNSCGIVVGGDAILGANNMANFAPIVGGLLVLPTELDREAGNVLVVASSIEPVRPLYEGVNTCLVNSIASPIASHIVVGDSVENEAVSPLGTMVSDVHVGSQVAGNGLVDLLDYWQGCGVLAIWLCWCLLGCSVFLRVLYIKNSVDAAKIENNLENDNMLMVLIHIEIHARLR
ncbi:hypothetical protein IEQ34_010723 [Dendrobium chrysotoxum]|uniref:Uncharacterized protein n=1 Tax=Dendrobium chrysotoxum TaxID=161865 RepID=A0AAV7GVG6_DENCH|nr:hypothetical protein IEQ34_010723 [Dendrobium chrysotoxum]